MVPPNEDATPKTKTNRNKDADRSIVSRMRHLLKNCAQPRAVKRHRVHQSISDCQAKTRAFVAWALFILVRAMPAAATDPVCDRSYAPFSTIPGAALTATDFTSKDDPPVRYTMWRGTVPSFD